MATGDETTNMADEPILGHGFDRRGAFRAPVEGSGM
jgi:hypothetical protein